MHILPYRFGALVVRRPDGNRQENRVPMPDTTPRALWITGPKQAAIRATPFAPPTQGEVLVSTLYSGISRGTESLVFNGHVPESQWAAMRAPLQEGDFPFPVKYGYSSVGRVDAGPADLVDRFVFCLHPHQDRFKAPIEMVHPIPPSVPAERAVLAANMETAVTIIWDARITIGDRLTVVGGGVVGCLVAWLAAQVPGTVVTVVDPDLSKAPAARSLGLTLIPPAAVDALPPQDRVIHTSASPDGLRQALALAGTEATVVEASWFGTAMPAIPLGEAFHARRLTLRSSQVGRLPPDQAPRWTHARRMACALSLLEEQALDALISGESAFDDLPTALAALAADSTGVLMHRIRYDVQGN